MWLKRIPGSSAYGLVEVGMLTFKDDKPEAHYYKWIRLLDGAENQANVVTAIVNAVATCARTQF